MKVERKLETVSNTENSALLNANETVVLCDFVN